MTNDHPPHNPICGAILAGGLARRLGGGDKALRRVGGRTLLDRLVDRLTPQVTRLVLNANGDPTRFAGLTLPIVADSLPDHPGPLAGVLAALDWAALSAPDVTFVVTAPVDVPFIPTDLVTRLQAERRLDGSVLACAASQGRMHPVVALWPVSIRQALRQAVATQGVNKVEDFIRQHRYSIAHWPTDPVDPFFNINTLDDLNQADRLLTEHPALK